MKNSKSILLSKERLFQTMMIAVLTFCTFYTELFPESKTTTNKENKVVITDYPDFFVFDAFIGFSEERYDGGFDSQPSETSFSVLNPRLYQIHESLRPEYRSFIIDY